MGMGTKVRRPADLAQIGQLVRLLLIYLLVAAAVTGCQVKLISDYDETTDRMASSLQKMIDDKFGEWLRLPPDSPALKYDANRAFYATVDGDLRSLRSRALAQPLNQDTITIVDSIISSMKTVEDLHRRAGTISAAALASVENQLDFQFQQLIKLELAKKRA